MVPTHRRHPHSAVSRITVAESFQDGTHRHIGLIWFVVERQRTHDTRHTIELVDKSIRPSSSEILPADSKPDFSNFKSQSSNPGTHFSIDLELLQQPGKILNEKLLVPFSRSFGVAPEGVERNINRKLRQDPFPNLQQPQRRLAKYWHGN